MRNVRRDAMDKLKAQKKNSEITEDDQKHYERLGIKEEETDILGIKVPSITIPVRPGRNLAIIVEVAAINFRQKKMGYNAAKALTDRVFGPDYY